MILLLVVLLEIYLIELRTEKVYGLLSSPSFVKRGQEGDLTIPIYLKLISPTHLYKRGFFNFIRNIFKG